LAECAAVGRAGDVALPDSAAEARPTESEVHVVRRLLSVNVGIPKDVPWYGKTVFTGVYKDSVVGRRHVMTAARSSAARSRTTTSCSICELSSEAN